jgi:hypothetical protein
VVVGCGVEGVVGGGAVGASWEGLWDLKQAIEQLRWYVSFLELVRVEGGGVGSTMGVGRWDTCILEVVARRHRRERSFWWKYLIAAGDVILKL